MQTLIDTSDDLEDLKNQFANMTISEKILWHEFQFKYLPHNQTVSYETNYGNCLAMNGKDD